MLSHHACRSLELSRSGASVLHLVSTGLQSLQLNLSRKELAAFEQFIRKAGSLKCLTSLELHYFYPRAINTRPLQWLPLRELSLYYCQGLELELLVPGALLSLTSLHIRETKEELLQVKGHKRWIKDLAHCGQIILGLPHLTELSGSSALFAYGMKKELKAWKASPYHNDSVRRPIPSVHRRQITHFPFQVWRRP